MKWVVLISLIIAGGITWVIYLHLAALESDPSKIPQSIPVGDKLLVTHMYRDGHHIYSGEIKMPGSCYSIRSVVTQTGLPDPGLNIYLTTVDERLKYTVCSNIHSGIPYDMLVDAPKDIPMELYVDNMKRAYTLNEVPWNDQIKPALVPLTGNKL